MTHYKSIYGTAAISKNTASGKSIMRNFIRNIKPSKRRRALCGSARHRRHSIPPITKWQNELASKSTEKESLYQEYYILKDETHKVEKIRASVKAILHKDSP